VWVPKVFNGKNRVFFYFAYEGFADAYATPAPFTVPTADEIGGNFSRLLSLNSSSKNYTLYDPNTATLSGSTITRNPFPGNIIPTNRLNSIATNFLKQYTPAPNIPNFDFAHKDDTNYYLGPENTIDRYHSFSGRTDI